MSSWSSRRKFIYTLGVVLFLTSISYAIFWKFWYKPATCFDRLWNGDETGLDCGGSCSLVCPAEALPPVTRSDPRLFEVSPGVYSALTFAENHNPRFTGVNVPYSFKIYDEEGTLIYERKGNTPLPKNRISPIFEGNIYIKDATPKRVTFEISSKITWVKDNKEPLEIKIEHSPINSATTTPKIFGSIENRSLQNLKNVEVVAVVMDGKDNAIAASRTFIDSLNKNSKAQIFFTWPQSFNLPELICDRPVDAELLIDRSGSMSSLGKNPPEPLTSVKSAASLFVDELRDGDRASLISFATSANNPPDVPLTSDFESFQNSLGGLSIAQGEVQYTNIKDAINAGRVEFFSSLNNSLITKPRKVIIILTDGVANRPASPEEASLSPAKKEEADIVYAEKAALGEADQAKREEIEIFSIGLGKEVHQEFLKSLASSPKNYFSSPTAADLKKIYLSISKSICQEVPARIEVLYKLSQ